ncbi:FAS1 domain-containing protein [Globomyces pollinis-pini]|nr:FAS1 domain-containing protein [Globomyces pollinis-pini]
MKLFIISLISIIKCAVLNHQQVLTNQLINDHQTITKTVTLLEKIELTPELSTVAALIYERPNLVEALSRLDINYTIFAPINSAFKKLRHPPPPEEISNMMYYHIVLPAIKAEELHQGQLLNSDLFLDSLHGVQKLKVTQVEGIWQLNDKANLVSKNIVATNGVIHIIDTILTLPSNLIFNIFHKRFFQFGAFGLALKRTGLDQYLRIELAITIFAPTNQAFKKLGFRRIRYLFSSAGKEELTRICLSHVGKHLLYSEDAYHHKKPISIPTYGEDPITITVDDRTNLIRVNNEAVVVILDDFGSNGVIQGIDSVLGMFLML